MGLLKRPNRGVAALETSRLRLEVMTAALLNTEAHDSWHLAEALGVGMAADWPPQHWEPPVRAHITAQLTQHPETAGWHRYIVLTNGTKPVLVGCLGAFPGAAGDAELGYSVVGSWQGRGLASEAVEGLVGWLFRQGAVHSVSAQAYESSAASVKVMERCGMRFVGGGDEAGTVKYRRWR